MRDTIRVETNQADIEVIVRSSVGLIRAWLDDDGAIRTTISAEIGVEASDRAAGDMLAVLDKATKAARGVVGAARREEPRTPYEPTLQLWLAERCTLDAASRTRSAALYEDYVAWCERRDIAVPSHRFFADMLTARGLRTAGKDAMGRKLRSGVALKPALAAETPLKVVG